MAPGNIDASGLLDEKPFPSHHCLMRSEILTMWFWILGRRWQISSKWLVLILAGEVCKVWYFFLVHSYTCVGLYQFSTVIYGWWIVEPHKKKLLCCLLNGFKPGLCDTASSTWRGLWPWHDVWSQPSNLSHCESSWWLMFLVWFTIPGHAPAAMFVEIDQPVSCYR